VIGLCVGVLGAGGLMYYYKEPSAVEKLAQEMLADRRRAEKASLEETAKTVMKHWILTKRFEDKTFEEAVAASYRPPLEKGEEKAYEEFLKILRKVWDDPYKKEQLVQERNSRDNRDYIEALERWEQGGRKWTRPVRPSHVAADSTGRIQ
jgi:hypothetical protein